MVRHLLSLSFPAVLAPSTAYTETTSHCIHQSTMPRAPRQRTNQAGSASKRPAYQAAARSRAPARASVAASASALATATATSSASASSSSATATATAAHATATAAHATATAAHASTSALSSASASALAPAPVPAAVVAPLTPADRRQMASQSSSVTRCFGSGVIKMILGIHTFIVNPGFGAGALTTDRGNELAGIIRLRDMNKAMGCTYLCCGIHLALLDFALLHDLGGYTRLSQYHDDYLSSRGANGIDEGPGAPYVVRIERILGYVFNNKKLLKEALTEPFNDTSIRPNYERLEFLGDSVLDVVAASAWIDRGEPLGQVCTKAQVTVNNATLTVVGLEAGLEAFIMNRRNSTTYKIHQMKEHLRRQRAKFPPNKAYWTKDDKVKPLADVVEAVFGAVFLDSGLRLSAVEHVFRRIFWPLVERRMA